MTDFARFAHEDALGLLHLIVDGIIEDWHDLGDKELANISTLDLIVHDTRVNVNQCTRGFSRRLAQLPEP